MGGVIEGGEATGRTGNGGRGSGAGTSKLVSLEISANQVSQEQSNPDSLGSYRCKIFYFKELVPRLATVTGIDLQFSCGLY